MIDSHLMQSSTDNDEISLKELFFKIKAWFLFLLGKWKLMCIIGLLSGGLGFIYAYRQAPVYTATLTFALEDEKAAGGLSGALGLASQFGIDLGTNAGGAFSSVNLMTLMKSRSIIEKALLSPVMVNKKRISLVEMFIEHNDIRKSWKEKKELQNIQFLPNADRTSFSLQQDSILGVIFKELSTNSLEISQKDKKVSIFTIETKSDDELFAKYFTEILASKVSQFYIDTKTQRSAQNVAILQKQTDSVRSELNAALSGVAAANDKTFNLNPGLYINKVTSLKKQIDVQASTALLIELIKNLELSKVALRKETPLLQIIDKPILPLKKEKVSKLKTMILWGTISGLIIVALLTVKRWWEGIINKKSYG